MADIGPVQTVSPLSSHRLEQVVSTSDMFDKMEATHAKIDQKKMQADFTPTHLKNVPMHLQRQALEVADEICEKTGQESVTKRLARLMARVAEATEAHIFKKRETQHDKKVKIDGTLDDLRYWKNYQAWTQCGGGFGSAFLTIAGNLLGGPVGQVLTGLTQLTPSAAQSLSIWIDGKQMPLVYKKDFFLSTVSTDKQTLEGLKQLPKEMQQLIQRLLDLELQAYRAVSQR